MICLKISIFVVSTTTNGGGKGDAQSCDLLKNIYLCGINNNGAVLQTRRRWSCDLLKNIYLCGINNNSSLFYICLYFVVICLKISTFVVSTTTSKGCIHPRYTLWFAWKYLPLWYQQQRRRNRTFRLMVVICLKISTFVVSTTTGRPPQRGWRKLWFAWKYLPLWYQQQLMESAELQEGSCDLLENIYLCGINNNIYAMNYKVVIVVICLKISTFVVSTTTLRIVLQTLGSCDLLENIYLCGINNNCNV